MTTIASPKIKMFEDASVNYEYLLAVTTDSLYVMSSEPVKVIETIIKGVDKDGWLIALDSQDDMLDAITLVKSDILAGRNPVDWILKSL